MWYNILEKEKKKHITKKMAVRKLAVIFSFKKNNVFLNVFMKNT